MKTKIFTLDRRVWIGIFLFSVLCPLTQAANDFSEDGNCVALWRFENGALTTDSKGSNTLVGGGGSPTADTVNFKEGAASVEIDNSDYYNVNDGDLDAGFPLKNGDANKKISVCFWVKFASIGSYDGIFNKGSSNKYSFQVHTGWSNEKMTLGIGYNNGSSLELITFGTACSTGIWYHMGVTYQDSDKSYKMRIYDDNAGALLGGSELTGNTTNNINIEDGIVTVGKYSNGSYYLDGLIDEMVIFNDILSSDEIDQIRAGTYGVGGGGDPAQIF
jgi:hypothetical protein